MLVPVDGSEASLAAVRQAAILARDCKTGSPAITLLHVVDLALLGLTLAEEANFLLEEGQQALATARQILDQTGLQEYTQEKLVSGIPAQAIAREAEVQQAALIVMGSVGHSALARFLIGSVTSSRAPSSLQTHNSSSIPLRQQIHRRQEFLRYYAIEY